MPRNRERRSPLRMTLARVRFEHASDPRHRFRRQHAERGARRLDAGDGASGQSPSAASSLQRGLRRSSSAHRRRCSRSKAFQYRFLRSTANAIVQDSGLVNSTSYPWRRAHHRRQLHLAGALSN